MNKTKVNITEIKEKAEADRDASWVESLALYVPEVNDLYATDDITIEQIIANFVTAIRNKSKPEPSPRYGQVEINLP